MLEENLDTLVEIRFIIQVYLTHLSFLPPITCKFKITGAACLCAVISLDQW